MTSPSDRRTRVLPKYHRTRTGHLVLTHREQIDTLELFSGTGSVTKPYDNRGHPVYRVELDRKFEADLHADVLDLDPADLPGPFKFVWASIPCTSYSVGSFRHHWHASTECRRCGRMVDRLSGEVWSECDCPQPSPRDRLLYRPKSETAELGQALLRKTLALIDALDPRWWIIENPRALMRKMPELVSRIEDPDSPVEMRTITHCQYGDPRRMKPTDLFGVFPDGFEARACKNGAPCHEAAPRGAKTGTQGLNKTESAMLPPDLGLELCLAMEAEMDS